MARPGRLLAAAPAMVLQLAGVLTIAFLAGRAVYYPFWAAHAAPDQLARSWGGPTPVGATLTHWVVAAAGIALAWQVFRLGRRWRRRLLGRVT